MNEIIPEAYIGRKYNCWKCGVQSTPENLEPTLIPHYSISNAYLGNATEWQCRDKGRCNHHRVRMDYYDSQKHQER